MDAILYQETEPEKLRLSGKPANHTNIDLNIYSKASGSLILDGLHTLAVDGTAGQTLTTDAAIRRSWHVLTLDLRIPALFFRQSQDS